jgi:hypothetical protein
MLRSLVACAAFTLTLVVTGSVSANPTTAAPTAAVPMVASGGVVMSPALTPAAQRQAIREMPLLMRPNRPGHFYGNTVRRLYYGRSR